MTTYELIKSIGDYQRQTLISAGIIPVQWNRYLLIYECWLSEVRRGANKMDAYCTAGEKYYTCEENVRKIVARMQATVLLR